MEEPKYYLTSGSKTQIGKNVYKKAEEILNNLEGKSSEEIVKNIMILVKDVCMKKNSKDNKKFKRSAEDILEDGYRNGCCDSSTLFVTLCRACGIPAAQIVTINLKAVLDKDFSRGHFFSACFFKEANSWFIIDSNTDEIKELKLHKFDKSLKIIDKNYYIFGVLRDYSDFDIDGLKIDSISNMNKIHKKVYEKNLKNVFQNKSVTQDNNERISTSDTENKFESKRAISKFKDAEDEVR